MPNDSHLLVLFGALRKQAYFGYGRTDDVNWYGHPPTTQTGVRQVRVRAYNGYGYRCTVGTETGVHTGVQGKLYCDTYRTTKKKWVAGLACNFFLYDHSLMNNVMKIMNTLNRY